MDNKLSEMWDGLIEMGVGEETLCVVCAINGLSTDTLDDVEFAVNGTHDLIEGEGEGDEDE